MKLEPGTRVISRRGRRGTVVKVPRDLLTPGERANHVGIEWDDAPGAPEVRRQSEWIRQLDIVSRLGELIE
jgi:hypothetical protein